MRIEGVIDKILRLPFFMTSRYHFFATKKNKVKNTHVQSNKKTQITKFIFPLFKQNAVILNHLIKNYKLQVKKQNIEPNFY